MVLRESTPAERYKEAAFLTLAFAYSLLYWAVVGLQLWSALRRL